jgi:hypothetical protein
METLKPKGKRGMWKAESNLRRVRRCLGFLRSSNLVSAAEQARISARVSKWRKHQPLRQVVRAPEANSSSIEAMVEPWLVNHLLLSNRKSAMRDTIEERFRAFHAANPVVYKHLVRLTRELYHRDRERIGIRCLWEQIRWHVAMGIIRVKDDYKLNDNYTSRYVRMLIKDVPAWKSLFETRLLRSL